jgi:hypothetical protein
MVSSRGPQRSGKRGGAVREKYDMRNAEMVLSEEKSSHKGLDGCPQNLMEGNQISYYGEATRVEINAKTGPEDANKTESSIAAIAE